jgi:hypothetical protein
MFDLTSLLHNPFRDRRIDVAHDVIAAQLRRLARHLASPKLPATMIAAPVSAETTTSKAIGSLPPSACAAAVQCDTRTESKADDGGCCNGSDADRHLRGGAQPKRRSLRCSAAQGVTQKVSPHMPSISPERVKERRRSSALLTRLSQTRERVRQKQARRKASPEQRGESPERRADAPGRHRAARRRPSGDAPLALVSKDRPPTAHKHAVDA